MRYLAGSVTLCAALALSLGACGDSSNPGTDAGGDPADADPGTPPGAYTVTWGPFTVQPGEEGTRCVVVPVGNTEQLRVGQIINDLGDASHHFIVYRTADTAPRAEPYICDPFQDTLNPDEGAPLMITQKAYEVLELPQGVAFTLGPDQYVRLEMHFINTGTEPKEVKATSTLVPIVEADFQHEADFLFIGNPDINLQPNMPATLGPSYFPLPSSLAGSNFFGITGHTHRLGTNVYVATTTGSGGADTPVYDLENFSWDEPETVYHDPPFQVPSGGGFRFSCAWMNTTDQTVTFGESANQEMCFFWAYYYPSKGAKVCIHTDQFGGFDFCCPDNATLCNQLF